MISITELAEHIVLDEVTDTFYRTLCFSNFTRSSHDPKSSLERQLDQSVSNKLSRQLNWSSSLCSLENATHKMTHLIAHFLKGKLSPEQLQKEAVDNYWLAAAIENEKFDAKWLTSSCNIELEPKIDKALSAVVYRYFNSQLNVPYRHLAEQVQLFSDVVIEYAMAESEGIRRHNIATELQHLAFFNVYPFIVLLMLLDKSVQSAKQELLNQIGFECELSRDIVRNYQPCAEQVLSFLVFDEFIKHHIHEALDTSVTTNIEIELEQCEALQQLFLQARTKAILHSLSHIPILTEEQKANFSAQLGIKVAIKQDISDSFASLLKRCIPAKLHYNISLPI